MSFILLSAAHALVFRRLVLALTQFCPAELIDLQYLQERSVSLLFAVSGAEGAAIASSPTDEAAAKSILEDLFCAYSP